MITIYAIRCTLCGKQYVGATQQLLGERFLNHLSTARSGLSTALARDIRTHGETAFAIRPLAEARTVIQADKLERHFIRELNTLAPNGLNLQSGGQLQPGPRRRKMAALRRLGVPDSVIAEKFDISKQRVGQILGPKKQNGKAKPRAL
jgi:GIY-YIG catalytic domain